METGDPRYEWINTTFFTGEGRILAGLCLARFGESYRRYLSGTGHFAPRWLTGWLPQILQAAGAARVVALAALYLTAVPIVVPSGFRQRARSLAQVAALYEKNTAVLSLPVDTRSRSA